MKFKDLSLMIFLVFVILVTAAAIAGTPRVPFHPDESTFLYLSGDFNLLWQNPLAMAWQPELKGDLRQLYRTLDAPVGRYLVGLGRWAAGLAPLPSDWGWGLTWEENRLAGAMPSPQLLLAGRLAVTALLPFSLLFLFLTGRRLANERVAWTAALLLAGNALVLLHGRRAVSEGAVIFTTALTLWTLVKAEKRPYLVAFPAALAFCAKHSLLALAPVGLLAVLLPPAFGASITGTVGRILRHTLLYLAFFAATVIVLNPFIWAHPIAALQDAMANRQDLVQRQVADRPAQALNSPGLRLISMLGSLYLTPPLFAETGNYAEETRPSEEAYMTNPLHNLLRSLVAGALLFLAGLYGSLVLTVQTWKQRPLNRRALLLLAATMVQTLALLALVQLPFQRYYMPLVPFACLWAAYGLDRLASVPLRQKKAAVPPTA